jgi:flotillin
VSAPLARTDKIVMIGSNGSSGASKITKDVTTVMAELPAVLEALTGMKLEDLAKRIPKVANGNDTVEAEAEELS